MKSPLLPSVLPLLLVLCLPALLSGAEFRVRSTNGVPRIEKDGVAVRPRWFYGGVGRSPLALHGGDQRVEYPRISVVGEDCELTFHFRFALAPAEYYLDDFQVIRDDTGEELVPLQTFDDAPAGPFLSLPGRTWEIWPRDPGQPSFQAAIQDYPGEPGNPAIKITFTPEARNAYGNKDPHLYLRGIRVKLEQGVRYTLRFRMWSSLEEATVTPGVYIPHPIAYRTAFYEPPEYDSSFSRQIQMAHQAGVDFVTTILEVPWPESLPQNFSSVDCIMDQILHANPQAYVIPRLMLYAPEWWKNQNPDELMKWDEASTIPHRRDASVSSQKWLQDALRMLEGTIRHLEEKYGDHIAGYHPCAQETQEWFYRDSWKEDFHGYSPAEIQGFRRWLGERYESDEALQRAWGRKDVTRETAQPPSPEERRSALPVTAVLDPLKNQRVVDHNIFLQNAMTDAMLQVARRVREITGEKKLVLFFYGYINAFARMQRMSACGHLDNQRLLASPDIDILCSPIDYTDRWEGEAGLAMTPAESILRAGKLWFYEDDSRTYLAGRGNLGGLERFIPTPRDTRNVLLRHTAQEAVRNLGCWWMDLSLIGWFEDPMLWTVMEDLREMDERKLQNPVPYVPAVAATSSERSAIYTKDARNFTFPAYELIRGTLSRCGAAGGMYYLEDLMANGVDTPVLILGNAWVLTRQERQTLKERLQGKTILWCHAPGILDPEEGCSLENSRELTGFALTPKKGDAPAAIQATETGKYMGLPDAWTPRTPARQNFSLEPEPGDLVLARWADDQSPALLQRENTLFCASPEVPRELVHYLLYIAGEHIYTQDNVVFYTDGTYLVLHATRETPPEVQLDFPSPVSLREAGSGKVLTPGPVTSFNLPLDFAETKVLEMFQPDKSTTPKAP
ncbi:MAG: beta-galactosidase [Oligosphaeraceae bacterium]